MKTFRLIGMALFIVLVSVGFTACSSDGEDNGDGGNTPSVSKRLVKVTTQEDNNTFCDEYTYDSNGRIVKVVNKKNGDNSGYTIYTYTDNLIVKKQYYTGSDYAHETKYELENGLIVKKTSGSKTRSYTYNNGYLSTLIHGNVYVEGGDLYNVTWRDGNLMNKKSAESDLGDSYEYTSYATPANFIYLDCFDDGNLAPFYGKSPKNLPSKRIEVNKNVVLYDDNGNPNAPEKVTEVFSYDWTMKDGLPIELIVTKDEYDGLSTAIVGFEWE